MIDFKIYSYNKKNGVYEQEMKYDYLYCLRINLDSLHTNAASA